MFGNYLVAGLLGEVSGNERRFEQTEKLLGDKSYICVWPEHVSQDATVFQGIGIEHIERQKFKDCDIFVIVTPERIPENLTIERQVQYAEELKKPIFVLDNNLLISYPEFKDSDKWTDKDTQMLQHLFKKFCKRERSTCRCPGCENCAFNQLYVQIFETLGKYPSASK